MVVSGQTLEYLGGLQLLWSDHYFDRHPYLRMRKSLLLLWREVRERRHPTPTTPTTTRMDITALAASTPLGLIYTP